MISISLYKELQTAKGEMPLTIDLQIVQGEFTTLYGASGAGKTSILKMLAGLLTPDKGKIIVNEKTWLDTAHNINLSPQQRKIGFVFQEYALFPNMTVRNNIAYALNKNQNQKIVEELIDVTELGDLQYQKPKALSGGQQQRVALARALVQQPSILLLDEPLSALDNAMRIKLQEHLLDIHKKYELTTLLVSHNITEILKLSNTIHVLENGKIKQSGHPLEIFNPHRNTDTFQLTGEIITIEKKEIDYCITVLVGVNTIDITVSQQNLGSLKIGDRILLKTTHFKPTIQKVI